MTIFHICIYKIDFSNAYLSIPDKSRTLNTLGNQGRIQDFGKGGSYSYVKGWGFALHFFNIP